MRQQYEPGTVAVATVRGVPNVQVVRCLAYDTPQWFCPLYQESDERNGWWPDDDEVTDIRPLVVLDPEDVAQVRVLNLALGGTLRDHEAVASALRSLLPPPKPPEPTGLGAVVEDAEGHHWVRAFFPGADASSDDWRRGDTPYHSNEREWHRYADIDAVRIVGEGVQP